MNRSSAAGGDASPRTSTQARTATEAIEAAAIDAVRFLSIDAVQKANSGHPGAPLALAPLAYLLYTRHLRHDPAAPEWIDRDRLVLSAGHASMLLYASLHLAGYELPLAELERFRQWESKTPGHPERGLTPGVEVTTGPLGQGFANAVGMALAERLLAERFNHGRHAPVDHCTWAICSDGDMMEGVCAEAASLAGRLGEGLAKLTVFYDDNSVTLDGPRAVEMDEDVSARFRAYGWHVQEVGDGNDLGALDSAIAAARAEALRPSLIVVRTHIGYGSPKVDSHEAHGAPLGAEAVAATRAKLGWEHAPFVVPDEVYAHWRDMAAARATSHADWRRRMEAYRAAEPELARELERCFAGRLPEDWRAALPRFEPGKKLATRKSAAEVLAALAARVPELFGGSADLSSSTYAVVAGSPLVNEGDWSGRNLQFGVREHAMGSMCNGMAAHGGLRPFCSTFLAFSDYMRAPIRLSALMHLPVVFVFSHDSIGLGEDGPTHQPIEHVATLRAIPNLRVFRPADANESAGAWAAALAHDGPSAIVLSRQALPTLDPKLIDVERGASLLAPGDDAAIVATGSEVHVALAAREQLSKQGIAARVVSLCCFELFRAQPDDVRERILPRALPTVAVEAASPFGWHEFADEVVALARFGASAPGEVLYRELGITAEAVAERVVGLARALVRLRRGGERAIHPIMDFSAADAAYRPFLPFEAWARSPVDEERWRAHESSLAEVKKVDPSLLGKALELVRRFAAIETGAIEGLYVADRGFTFTVAAQTALMEQALGRRTDRERALIEDQLRAYEHVLDFATRRVPIAEAWIREIHAELCKSQETYTVKTDLGPQEHELPLGRYKSMPNHVLLPGGGTHAYAPVHDTPVEMARLVRELESDAFSSAHPVLQCAYAHHALVAVHPFADGNGRVARALGSVYICRAYSLPLLILADDQRAYFDALATADHGNPVPFIDFVLGRCVDAVDLVRDSLRLAAKPSVDEQSYRIAELYRTRGGYSHTHVDQAAMNLRGLFEHAWDENKVRLAGANVTLETFPHDKLAQLARPDSRHTVSPLVPALLVKLTCPPPAEAKVSRTFGFEVPRDCGPEGEVVIADAKGVELFSARVSDLLASLKSNLRVRVAMLVEQLAGELLDALHIRAEQSRRSKGY